ncbi:hypothetical protein WUBG_17523 [Wuchereria bancrofti]|uniref:Uncharacterized protein n=1 Tax=Wuchereria bancrofti TaxID=6293 RepID=J9DPN6_WUCBA|nr:hypothetical protein WUBG_17523 [Wuchereria bancrofti]VDM21517.1 unnamed protein product [Wuchereria bancrofti]
MMLMNAQDIRSKEREILPAESIANGLMIPAAEQTNEGCDKHEKGKSGKGEKNWMMHNGTEGHRAGNKLLHFYEKQWNDTGGGQQRNGIEWCR